MPETQEAAEQLVRYRKQFTEQVDAILGSGELPASGKLAAFVALFDGSKEGANPWLCLFGTAGDDLITRANDYTGAIHGFRMGNVSRLQRLLEEGVREDGFRLQGDSHTMATMMLAILDQGVRTAPAAASESESHYAAVMGYVVSMAMPQTA